MTAATFAEKLLARAAGVGPASSGEIVDAYPGPDHESRGELALHRGAGAAGDRPAIRTRTVSRW